jgi:hypothetical protein
MKNWLPLVSAPELAMAIMPVLYSAGPAGADALGSGEALGLAVSLAAGSGVGRFSSANRYPGPPLPVADGSPH